MSFVVAESLLSSPFDAWSWLIPDTEMLMKLCFSLRVFFTLALSGFLSSGPKSVAPRSLSAFDCLPLDICEISSMGWDIGLSTFEPLVVIRLRPGKGIENFDVRAII